MLTWSDRRRGGFTTRDRYGVEFLTQIARKPRRGRHIHKGNRATGPALAVASVHAEVSAML